MFENMVIVELLKALWNRGRRDVLSFYRDSNGHEIDVVLERQGIPSIIEIKASRTFSPDFLRSARKFRELVLETAMMHVILRKALRFARFVA